MSILETNNIPVAILGSLKNTYLRFKKGILSINFSKVDGTAKYLTLGTPKQEPQKVFFQQKETFQWILLAREERINLDGKEVIISIKRNGKIFALNSASYTNEVI